MTRTPLSKVSARGIFIVFVFVQLLGCGLIHTHTAEEGHVTMTEAQFAAYVERVFRHHNRVMNDLIERSQELSENDNDLDDITDAEEEMNMSCEPLNEVVSAEIASENASFWTQRLLPEAVPDCEEATRQLELLLQGTFNRQQ